MFMLKLGGGHMGVSYMKFSVWLKYFIIKIISLRKNNTTSFPQLPTTSKVPSSSFWYFSLDYYNILTDLPVFILVSL